MAESGVQPSPGSRSSVALPFPFAGHGPLGGRQETVVSAPRSADPPGDGGGVALATVSPVVEKLFPGAATPAPADEAAGITVGHFIIERRIGSGGMGTVFLAQDERLQRPVALKVLAPRQTADPGSVQRFQNEARAAARLDHDHIARVFFYGEDQGLHYIAYEFVQGATLRDLIRVRGRLDPSETVAYAVQLAAALCHTSASGVVHRDIKPSNIIITPQGKAKLVDLGLARKESLEESAQLTVAGTTLGTFDYISPEQAKDPRGVDVRSDIYSLGCTLYHALTGELPFPEGTVLQRLLDHQDKPPADPALKNRRISPALSAVIRKMMASDARKRYQTAEDLLRDLLIVANALGLRGVASDGSLPSAWPRLPQGSFVQFVGWSIAVALLAGAVAALSLRPDLLRVMRGETPPLAAKRSPETKPPSPESRPADDAPRVADASARAQPAPTRDEQPTTPQPSELNILSQPGESLTAPRPRPGDLPLDPGALFGDERLRLPASVVAPETSVSGPPLPRAKVHDSLPAPTAAEERPRPAAAVERPVFVEPPAERLPPFVVVGSGKSFDSLDAACAEIRDQGTIELQFDGRLPAAQRPLRLINKRVTLQAARGRRPVLWFAPKETIVDNNQSRMIYVAGGSLSVMNVDLELQIPNQLSNVDLWAIFSCARPDHLRLLGVTATVSNPGHHAAALVELTVPIGDSMSKMGMMKDGMPFTATQIRVDRSLLRGECTGFRIRDAVSIRCDFEQSLFAVGEWLIQAELPVNAPPNPPRLTVSLDHTTCLLGNGLYSSQGGDDLSRRLLGVDFFPHDNVIATSSSQPLIDQQLASDQMEIRQLVLWNGDRNFFDQIDQFWVVHMPGAGTRGMNFEAWCSFWGASETAGSRNDPIAWRQEWRLKRWSEITADDARLDRSVAGNPPLKASAGGLDAGAALELLPGEIDVRKAGPGEP